MSTSRRNADNPSDPHPSEPQPGDHPQTPDLETGLSDGDFHETLSHLLGEIDTLPAAQREQLREAANATRRRQDQLRATVERLQDTLDYLRLNIKYLCFDVEVTRRENQYLRKVLDERGDAHA